jgi:hypothetical protein
VNQPGNPPTNGQEPDPWSERRQRAQSVAALWLATPGVLTLLRDVRGRLGSPRLDPVAVLPAVAEVMGIQLVLDAHGGLAQSTFAPLLEGEAGIAQLEAHDAVLGWVAEIDAVVLTIARLVPPDAPFEAWRSRLTIAELLLTDLNLHQTPAQIAAALQMPPTHAALDHLGGIDAAWFADEADIGLSRRLGRAFRPRRRRSTRYLGGQARQPNERAVRARTGVRALLTRYPTMTADLFEPHWERLTDGALGDLIWTSFAGPAHWTPTDGRYTQPGFARLLREVRAEGSIGSPKA